MKVEYPIYNPASDRNCPACDHPERHDIMKTDDVGYFCAACDCTEPDRYTAECREVIDEVMANRNEWRLAAADAQAQNRVLDRIAVRAQTRLYRLDEYIRQESYGASLEADDNIAAIIEICEGRARQHVQMLAKLEKITAAASLLADRYSTHRDGCAVHSDGYCDCGYNRAIGAWRSAAD